MQTTLTLQKRLVDILIEKGLRRLPAPIKLASGAYSSHFIDGKEALAEWRDLQVACKAIVERVTDAGHRFDAVGGLTLGADALAVGIAAVSDSKWFIVRKEAKRRGTRRRIEGAQIGPGDRVLVVDDVVTSGGSMLSALDAVRQEGAEIAAAVTLVDRGESAGLRFVERGVAYFSMATYKDLEIEPVHFG